MPENNEPEMQDGQLVDHTFRVTIINTLPTAPCYLPGWNATSPDGRLTIYEGATAYWCFRPAFPNEEHCMGDGVDWITFPDGSSILAGSAKLHEVVSALLKQAAWVSETIEAYFGAQE